ncbi:MAG: response regulator, partial [Anaerolineales bacterium]|nr:response regulator [Anaerolineales bacterium]
QASKYKSEFLANMSHELRTPLNSLLILARMLADNEAGNLSEDQVDSARIIYQSGSDLLMLINDILDLAKVEAGRMLFHFEPVAFSSIIQALHAQFDPLAEEHGLTFQTEVAEDVPATIINDQQRLLQVLKNLLSNAFKFTSQGSVRLVIEHPAPLYDLSPLACSAGEAVALRVIDTGIGMTIEQQQVVFEAFQQADGSTSRRYGGTGLGLTISREMITHLGGKLTLQSEYGKGSTFTIYLPLQPLGLVEQQEAAPTAAPEFTLPPALEPARQAAPSFVDDRATLRRGDRVLLLIEDDPAFARVIYDYAHNKGFKCLMAEDGESGLDMVKTYLPDAVILDLRLPGINGWQVLESIKKNASTRHIPVHILSAEEENIDAYKLGAIGFLTKPITLEDLETVFQKIEAIVSGGIKNLLVVEDDSALRHSIRQLLDGSDVQISEAAHGQAALEMLQAHPFDCMILDLNLPDMTGFELLNQINADPNIPRSPIIVYTGKAITEEENAEIMKYADSVIIKGAKSPERLLDETALFLHRVASDISNEKQALGNAPDRDAVFIGKHILVVDDEMRNAFALSRLLTSKGLKVSIARNGLKALEILESSDKIDLVLLDMMMPEMDGYETLHHLRSQPRFNNLPILALTAKAMKGDQEKCINAGASDYLAKPIDADRLFSMLRVWLYA